MKKTRIIRRLDKLGRIVIPKKIRDNLKIMEQDSIEMFVQDKLIILKKYDPNCIFCGNESDLIEFSNKIICKKCCEKLKLK